jgi:signal transduction histidine kinase
VIEADLKGMIIFTIDKESKNLKYLAAAQQASLLTPTIEQICENIVISLSDKANPLINVFLTGSNSSQVAMSPFITDSALQQSLSKWEQDMGVKSMMIFPLIARTETLGIVIIKLGHSQEELSEFKRDFLTQLPSVVGIALDNALLYQAIREANEKLKQLDKLKDDFVSLASHELRTPMTVIRSYLWMTLMGRGGPITDKQHFYLDRAYSSTVRLINLVNEMLNISRIESGRISVEIQKVELAQLTEDVVTEVKTRSDELGINLVYTQQQLPPVLADSDKVKEVLINLIGNSFKFTPKGGTITVSFDQTDKTVIVKVTDTGSGISKEDQDKLFQKFGMIEASYRVNKSDAQGTGLGLYICKSIIDMHKGTMSVFSEGIGRGSTFSFSLRKYSDAEFAEFQQLYSHKKGLEVIHSSYV